MKPFISTDQNFERLRFPASGKIRMILDTDTFNEIDDQFAVTYALLSPERIKVEAITAAPFFNELSCGPEDGMEKSYDEILRLLDRMNIPHNGLVYKGSKEYLQDKSRPVISDAANRIVELGLKSTKEDPLYVASIAAITNVASALLLEPSIANNIVVVWLGGNSYSCPDTREFNLRQDVNAAQVIFDCGVPVVHIPVQRVASHLITTLSEIETHVKGQGKIGDYLYQVFKECNDDHFGYSRVIWDISTIAYLIDEKWVPTDIVQSPIITSDCTWSFDQSRHLIKCANFIHRDKVFCDLFRKIQKFAKQK